MLKKKPISTIFQKLRKLYGLWVDSLIFIVGFLSKFHKTRHLMESWYNYDFSPSIMMENLRCNLFV